LFNFTKYLELGDIIKLESNKIDKELIARRGELKSVEEYINNSSILPSKELKEVPEIDEQVKYSIKELELKIHNIDADIKQIDKNNLYIRERNDINFSVSLQTPTNPQLVSTIQKTRDGINLTKRMIQEAKEKLKTLDLSDSCYACGQSLDNSQSLSLKNSFEEAIELNSIKCAEHEVEYKNLTKQQNDYENALIAYNTNKTSIERFETLSNLIDTSLPKNTPDKQQIDLELVKLKNSLKTQDDERNKVKRYNDEVTSHNTKMVILKEELQKFSSRQTELNSDIFNLQGKYDNLQILKKAFSTSGIVAYKLENVAKDLENTINRYLTVLSDGQFSVVFRLIGEKLNVVIVSNGKEVTIESLSGGEFSRVQTSVLLAVRSTLSKIGGNSINLLFLDEITGVLDDAGKEKLFEILSEEVGLNVFLISHDYSHPLIPKIEIEKENNISTMY
jgi:DNA repair exonuclease SbcCD ATPase subunit